MDRFVRRENIKRYRKLLRAANEEAERRLIQRLLIEEEQKEAATRSVLPWGAGETVSPSGAASV
jgi:hypothetical protein